MHLDLCTTEALRDRGIDLYIELNVSSPFLSIKPISRTVANIYIRAPSSLVFEQPSLKQSWQSVPQSSCSKFLQIWTDVSASVTHTVSAGGFLHNIRDLFWTSQISVEYERNLYSLLPCIKGFMSPQLFKMHFFFAECSIYSLLAVSLYYIK